MSPLDQAGGRPVHPIGKKNYLPLTTSIGLATFTVVIPFEVAMIAKQFEEMLAEQIGIPPSEADQRTRTLRAAGILPANGPRGRHAPDIDPVQASFMLLAMVSRRAVDAAPVALRASNLQAANSPFKEGAKLGAVLAALLQNPDTALMRRLLIAEDGSSAWMLPDVEGESVEWLWAETSTLGEIEREGTDPSDYGRSHLGRRFVIGGGAVAQLGIKLSRDVESGWHDTVSDLSEARDLLVAS